MNFPQTISASMTTTSDNYEDKSESCLYQSIFPQDKSTEESSLAFEYQFLADTEHDSPIEVISHLSKDELVQDNSHFQFPESKVEEELKFPDNV